jgi:purine-binding chemotaxis protein CheW
MSATMSKTGKGKEQTDLSAEDTRQYSTFFVGDLFFGVEVLRVQEVLRYQEMTRVPLAPDVVEGLINLRGQIVAAIDMRRRLELTPRAAGRTPLNMVVRSEDGVVSLLVDEIGDVLEVKSDSFEMPPDNVSGVARDLVQGVHKLKDRLLLILDTEKTIDLSVTGGPQVQAA